MQLQLKLALGSDLAGYDFKMQILNKLTERGYTVTDVGCNSSADGIYPIYAKKVADEILADRCDRGILVCGTGQGMQMAANKIRGIRAALATDKLAAILTREHNNSNILVFGAWSTDIDSAMDVLEAWLFGKYSGRHDDKLEMLDNLALGESIE